MDNEFLDGRSTVSLRLLEKPQCLAEAAFIKETNESDVDGHVVLVHGCGVPLRPEVLSRKHGFHQLRNRRRFQAPGNTFE